MSIPRGVQEVTNRLRDLSKLVDKSADQLGQVIAPDSTWIGKVFKQMVDVERRAWEIKIDIETLNDNPEIDAKLESILSTSRSSYAAIPNILSGLRTLAQLKNEELLKSDEKRNDLLESLRVGMKTISHELRIIQNLLDLRIED